MEKFVVDVTPVGMQTQEGVNRVQEALNHWHNTQATLANGASLIVRNRRDLTYGELLCELADLDDAVFAMAQAQEAFLRAVAGR
jgi:hypothetical protein